MSLPDCVEYEKLEKSGYFDAVNEPAFHCGECHDAVEYGEEYYEIKRTKYCRFCGENYVKENFIKEAR